MRRVLDLLFRGFYDIVSLLKDLGYFSVAIDHALAFVEETIHITFVLGDSFLKTQQVMIRMLLKGAKHADASLAGFAEVLDHLLRVHLATDVLLDINVEYVVCGGDLRLCVFFHAGFAHQLVAFDAFGFGFLDFFIDEFADFAEREFGDPLPGDKFVEGADEEVIRKRADAAGGERRPLAAHGTRELAVFRIPGCSNGGEMGLQTLFAERVQAREGLRVGEGLIADFAGQKLLFDFVLQLRVLLHAFSGARHLCFRGGGSYMKIESELKVMMKDALHICIEAAHLLGMYGR